MRRLSIIFNLTLGLALIAFTVEQAMAPNSWWIEIRKIYIPDFAVGDPPPLVAIDDSVRRPFLGHYFIDIRKVGAASDPAAAGQTPDLSRFTYFCSGSGEVAFRPGADPTARVDLDWWTRHNCPKFSEGSYYAQVIIEWRDFLTNRSLTIDSNVWNVYVPAPIAEAAPPQVIVQKPIIVQRPVVVKKVYRGEKCEPSLIPPRVCPPPRARRRDGERHSGAR